MDRLFFSAFTMAVQWFRPRYNVQLQFLEFQIRMLRSRIDAERIVPTAEEKAVLLRMGERLDHDIADLMLQRFHRRLATSH